MIYIYIRIYTCISMSTFMYMFLYAFEACGREKYCQGSSASPARRLDMSHKPRQRRSSAQIAMLISQYIYIYTYVRLYTYVNVYLCIHVLIQPEAKKGFVKALGLCQQAWWTRALMLNSVDLAQNSQWKSICTRTYTYMYIFLCIYDPV